MTIFKKSKIPKLFLPTLVFLMVMTFGLLSGSAAHGVKFSVGVPNATMLDLTILNPDNSLFNGLAVVNTEFNADGFAFGEKDLIVNVKTNNRQGYNLIMSVPSTSLTSKEGNNIDTLPNRTKDYTCSVTTATTCDFVANSWGFKIKNATSSHLASEYLPVTNSFQLNRSDRAVIDDKTYLSFGARVNHEQPSGSYVTSVVFFATANPVPTPTMQETTFADLDFFAPIIGDTVVLRDARDNQDYTVAKIDDGLYWMIDNLRTMGTISAELSNFYGDDFELREDSLLEGDSYDNALAAYDEEHPEYGAYYNYCAASVGTSCSNEKTEDARSDICPAGWRLPTIDEMTIIANATELERNVVLAGMYNGGNLYSAESYGFWWASTGYSGVSQNTMYASYRTINQFATGVDNKSDGGSIRCVYDITTIDDVDSLQDFYRFSKASKTSILNSMQEEVPYVRTDRRDGQEYNIAKLKDGRVWLLDNLRLGAAELTEGLSVENTNMSSEIDFDIEEAKQGSFSSNSEGYTTAVIDASIANEPAVYPASYTGEIGSVGAYYNYCAASAGTYCDDLFEASDHAEYDVCPAGWRMPTAGPLNEHDGEYDVIYDLYGGETGFFNILRTPLAGFQNGAPTVNAKGQMGYFTSCTDGFGVSMFTVIFGDSSFTINIFSRNNGMSVRCIVK